MSEGMTEKTPALETTDFRQTGSFILSSLTTGHGLFHWFSQSLNFMLPEIRDTF